VKTIFFQLQGYRDLPENFRARYDSIWVDLPNDELCDPATVGKYLNWTLDELELADDLGFDGVGTNEHHQNGYGFSASPHITAAILARKKSDAAICVLGSTLPVYPPLRVAEELGIIDCLSGGRLVAGWPVGTAMDTVAINGIIPDEVRPRYYEAHDLIKAAWEKPGPFAFNGKYTKLRYVNPWPKPIQKPHPPIWLAGGGSLETYHFAARNNYAYNLLSFAGFQAGRSGMQTYWDIIDSYGLDHNPYRAGFAQLICVADTDAEARRRYEKHVLNFYDKSLHVAPWFAAVPGYMTRASFENAVRRSGNLSPFARNMSAGGSTWETIVEQEGAVIAGSPDTVTDRLTEMIVNLNIGHLIAILQIQSMNNEETRLNTTLFAEKVLPRLRDIWKDSGYEDHWWPSGAARGPRVGTAQSASTAR
jgi:alkanesulfonate monooxygenase SsuD/methylene tetrahydromethanopterin reductase-like flavin-dependent oxidoreductase (luciferase family)